MSSSLNIVLFGQTGAGKSSVINLIAGRPVAEVSSGAAGCTLSFKPYTFPVNGRTLHIWDTVGLDEPGTELISIEIAINLIHELVGQGGVDLLLFCIRAPRTTATCLTNYRLFYEVLCRSQVPIAFVITHLEQEANMEKWWERNVDSLERHGLRAAGHACVTALPTHSKYAESRRNIGALLEGHRGDGRFKMPPDRWTVEFLRSFGLFAPLGREAKREDIIKVLLKRCNMDLKVAEEVADKLAGAY